jgi:hypothetical protein
MAGQRSLAVPSYRHRYERAFGPEGVDASIATHLRLTGGFFVESPALDGMRRSRTLFFARYRGWQGLLVEADADLARRCRALRPESTVEQATLVGPDEDAAGATACTLSAILDAHGVRRIDLLCLELADGAAGALRGLDLERHRPAHLVIDGLDRGALDDLIGGAYAALATLAGGRELYRLERSISRA